MRKFRKQIIVEIEKIFIMTFLEIFKTKKWYKNAKFKNLKS
jgi:hypothetical protein